MSSISSILKWHGLSDIFGPEQCSSYVHIFLFLLYLSGIDAIDSIIPFLLQTGTYIHNTSFSTGVLSELL